MRFPLVFYIDKRGCLGVTCGKWGFCLLVYICSSEDLFARLFMYLWLSPVVFLVLPCPGSLPLLLGAAPASPLPLPPGVWPSPCSPRDVTCALALSPPALTIHSKPFPPWQQLLLAGFGGSSSCPEIPAVG